MQTDIRQASEIEATLERLLHHTLEVMCFAEAERLPSPPSPSSSSMDQPITARVEFSGGRTGCLQLEVESRAARTLAAAFLGLEPWHPSLISQTGDTIEELTRVLCGRLVTSLDPATPFETTSVSSGFYKSAETIQQVFRVPAGILRITLQIS